MAKFLRFVSFLCISAGILILFGSLSTYFSRNVTVLPEIVFAKPETLHETKTKEKLTDTLIISKVGIFLSIFEGNFTHGIGDLRGDGVVHLATSPMVGEKGNGVYYAHNWGKLFGPLINVQVGDAVSVYDGMGNSYTYTIVSKQVVEPTENKYVEQTIDSRITLFTCAGFLDSKRLVVVAKLKS